MSIFCRIMRTSPGGEGGIGTRSDVRAAGGPYSITRLSWPRWMDKLNSIYLNRLQSMMMYLIHFTKMFNMT